MHFSKGFALTGLVSTARSIFRPRDLFFHDGGKLRRVHISTQIQAFAATATTAVGVLSLIGTAQIAGAAPVAMAAASQHASVAAMEARVSRMTDEVRELRVAAEAHAARLEARQAFLDAALSGKTPEALPVALSADPAGASAVVAPFKRVEGHQAATAARVTASVEARYRETAAALHRMGVDPSRFHGRGLAMGGPYVPVESGSGTAQPDPNFRALFQSWKKLDQLQQGIVSVPSQRPTDLVTFTSNFGIRTDPFRGTAAMHAGVDIPGPMGTSIYATADGIVGRAGWANGYGNLVELQHGRGIETRYGHLSAILVQPGQRVTRGQLIGRMGSTGRSTGSHLHYEVRLDGRAVNPMPFLQTANYVTAIRSPGTKLAVGGPISGRK